MKRQIVNLSLDIVLLVCVLGIAFTGLLMRWILPPGTGGRLSLWNMTRHEWGDVHFWLTVGFGSIVLLHLVMHWAWLWVTLSRLVGLGGLATTRSRRMTRGVVGFAMLALFAALMSGGLILAQKQVHSSVSSGGGSGWQNQSYNSEHVDSEHRRERRGRP